MKTLVTILFVLFTVLKSSAQQDSLLQVGFVDSIAGAIADFTNDNLGNIYLLTTTNQVKKLDAKGDSVAVYSDVRRFGKITSVDATNPFKILVYFKDFSTIVVLDRFLNVRTTINLRQQNIFQVRAITTSYDNNIWLFDELDSKLKKIDDNGRVILQTADFRQVFDSVPTPTNIYDRDGQLYFYDPKQGLLVFDYYGAKKNNYQMLGLKDLQVLDKNTITGRTNNQLLLYKPATLQMFSFKILAVNEKMKKVSFNGNKLFCLTNSGTLIIYTVQK